MVVPGLVQVLRKAPADNTARLICVYDEVGMLCKVVQDSRLNPFFLTLMKKLKDEGFVRLPGFMLNARQYNKFLSDHKDVVEGDGKYGR
jgi:hypothetical protein